MVLLHSLRLAGIGIAAGIVVALALTRVLGSLLYGVSATDPLVFAAVSIGLSGVAALAAYLPAARAASVDPIRTLRD
jgi:ABC-type antimicrobial peptide transport system permease subunit